jgi:hypothetical protein
LTSHAAGRLRQRSEAFLSDLSTTVLAYAISTQGPPVARVLGLLAIPLENLPDGLAVRPLAQDLSEVGFSETLAHRDLVSTVAAVETWSADLQADGVRPAAAWRSKRQCAHLQAGCRG